MNPIVAIDSISALDSIEIDNRAIGCTEYQFYKLLHTTANLTDVICFNKKTNICKINNVTYIPITQILDYNFKQYVNILYTKFINNNLIDKFKNYHKIWWRHNLFGKEEYQKYQYCIENTNTFVYPSNFSYNQFQKTYVLQSNAYVIPNILYPQVFDTTITGTQIPKNPNYLVYASAWTKGVEKIVDIVYDYNLNQNPITLCLMHPGYGLMRYDEQLNYIKQKIPEHHIILGKLNKKEYSKYIKGAFAVIAPNFKETFGCVFAESLYLGTPVIYDINNEALKDLVGSIGMCDYNNKNSIASVIDFFRSNLEYSVNLPSEYLLDHNIKIWNKVFSL